MDLHSITEVNSTRVTGYYSDSFSEFEDYYFSGFLNRDMLILIKDHCHFTPEFIPYSDKVFLGGGYLGSEDGGLVKVLLNGNFPFGSVEITRNSFLYFPFLLVRDSELQLLHTVGFKYSKDDSYTIIS